MLHTYCNFIIPFFFFQKLEEEKNIDYLFEEDIVLTTNQAEEVFTEHVCQKKTEKEEKIDGGDYAALVFTYILSF